MKLYPLILLVIGIAIAGVALFGWSSWQDKKRAVNAQELVARTHRTIYLLDEIGILVNRNESAMRGYVITGNKAFIVEYDHNYGLIQQYITSLYSLMSDSEQQLLQLEAFKEFFKKKSDFEKQLKELTVARPGSATLLIAGLNGKRIMDEISGALTLMKSVEDKLMHDRTLRTYHAASTNFKTIIGGASIALVFILLILLRLNRDVQLRRKAQVSLRESEKRYREFIENAGMVSFTSDTNGFFTFISNQVEALTGYTANELTGKHFTFLIEQEHMQEVVDHYRQQYLSKVHETTLKFPIVHKNGETKWVEQDTILLQKNDTLIGYQSVVKDITERTLMNQRLQEMELEKKAYQARVQAILDNTPLAIYVKDMEGKYILVNKQFRESFNVTEEEIIGKTIYDLKHKAAIEKHIEADNQIMEIGRPVEVEDVLRFNDGEHHMLTIKFPLFDHNNKMFGISGFMKDISEMVRNREELINARQRAEAAEMLQEQFLANMSHEIRTPMNGIIGMTNILQKTNLDPKHREYIQIIKQSSDNLLVLINDILDLSKIKAGKISIEKIPFHLESSLSSLIAIFKLKAEEKNIRFSFLSHPAVPVAVKGDPHRLNQVLTNLLSNAMKFTNEGYVTLEVGVKEISGEDAIISFQVNDTGIGIEEKNINYIFESFTQASSSTTRKYGGTGLGLTITKRLIEILGGEIHISSKLGKGSTFTVNMPLSISSMDEVNQSIMPGAKTVTGGLDFGGRKILIVEDNEINRIVLQNSLNQYNLEVAIATNGFEAVQYVEKNNDAALILMDLHMPVMDGFEATEIIRHNLKSAVPIVVLSASALKNEKQRSVDMGANDYLSKPFKPEELQDCLEKYLGINPSAQAGTVAEETVGETPGYDLSNLFQVEDAEVIKTIMRMFEKIVPESLEELKNEAIKEDWESVRFIAHKLKSSLGIVQVRSILSNMSVIEISAKEKKDLDNILSLVELSIKDYYETLPLVRIEVEKEIVCYQNR